MALTAPTVASDPASQTHTNTAFSTLTTFASNAYTSLIEIMSLLRERAVLGGATSEYLQRIDGAIASLGTGAGATASVASDPASQANTNTAFSTTTTKLDTLNTRALAALQVVIEHLGASGIPVQSLERFKSLSLDLASPSSLTAQTVASDPASQAHMNAALAATTAFIDTVNSEIRTALLQLSDEFRRFPGNSVLANRFEAAVNAFNI